MDSKNDGLDANYSFRLALLLTLFEVEPSAAHLLFANTTIAPLALVAAAFLGPLGPREETPPPALLVP